MITPIRVYFLVFAITYAFCSATYATKTHIVFGEHSAAGFGDFASNIYMAKKLNMMGEPTDVYVHQSFLDTKGPALLEIFDGFLKLHDIKITSYTDKDALVAGFAEGDHVYSFSFPSMGGGFGATRLGFPLPADSHVVSKVFSEYNTRPKTYPPSGRDHEIITTGIGAGATGTYISPVKPDPPPMSIINDYLLSEANSGSKGPIGPDERIGLSYVANYENAQKYTRDYVENVDRLSKETGQKSVVFIYWNPSWGDPPASTAEVRVISYNKIPFHVTEAIIGNSGLPNLVTGDGSLTIALDYEKDFIYQALDHKAGLDSRLGHLMGGQDSLGFGLPEYPIHPRKMKEHFTLFQRGHVDFMQMSINKIRAQLSMIPHLLSPPERVCDLGEQELLFAQHEHETFCDVIRRRLAFTGVMDKEKMQCYFNSVCYLSGPAPKLSYFNFKTIFDKIKSSSYGAGPFELNFYTAPGGGLYLDVQPAGFSWPVRFPQSKSKSEAKPTMPSGPTRFGGRYTDVEPNPISLGLNKEIENYLHYLFGPSEALPFRGSREELIGKFCPASPAASRPAEE